MTQTQRIVETGNGSAATDEVRRLLSLGKCKQAVELAKEIHKRLQSAESQQLVVDAYTARIAQFQAKGALEEARTLIKLVSDRYPAHRSALVALQVRTAAAEGKIDELVAPLIDPNVTPQTREAIETAIRRDLVDLQSLANCKTLPLDHPLRISAAAVWKAFEAASTAPLTDEQVSLPEVSRRSPLAGWKLFVRGLAAFYRNDEEGCRRSLESIAPDAAVAKLGKALLALLDQKPAVAPQGIGATLRQRVIGDEKTLRDSLEKLERAFTSYDESLLTRTLRVAFQACAGSRPDLVERLRQHISIRGMMYDVPVELIRHVTGPALKEAYYWRLAATACEKTGSDLSAATWWERFLRHGAAEGMFAANGKEAALIYLRMANLLSDQSSRHFRRHDFTERVRLIRDMYRGQPPEIAALTPVIDSEDFRNAADAGWNFRRSVELWPDSQAFVKWRQWTEKQSKSDKQLQNLAEVWKRKLPADPQAPLLLAKLAEARKAFNLALRHLADAEAIDAMNPEVRKARLRLTLGTTFRHFKDKKPHLIEKDLAELAAMPGMREGDRPAFLDALRAGMLSLQPNGAEAAKAAAQSLAERLGQELACVVMALIWTNSKMSGVEHWPEISLPARLEPAKTADAAARSYILANGLNLIPLYSPKYDVPLAAALQERPCKVSSTHLIAIGALALAGSYQRQAYLASSAGLESAAGTTAARFLLLRAQSMPSWAERRRDQCLRAAMELARPANDAALIDAIAAETDRYSFMRDERSSINRLSEELVIEIIKQERAAVEYPKDRADVSKFLVTIDPEPAKRSFFNGDSPFTMDFDDDDEDDEFDDDDDDDVPFGFGAGFKPPERESPAVKEFMDQFGGRKPTPQEMFSNPELAARVLRELGLGNVNPEVIKDMFSGGQGPFSSPGKKKKNKR